MEVIAGLALGVYPVVCELLDQYRASRKYWKNYRQFFNKFESFVMDIDDQRYNFELLLYDLMCKGPDPFWKDIDEFGPFLQIARNYTDWNNQELHEKLAMRLGSSYEFVLQRLNEICTTFEKLRQHLDIQNLHKGKSEREKWLFRWDRAMTTWFMDEYLENCTKMGDQIGQVQRRVASCDQIRGRETSSSIESFGRIWSIACDSATHLYNVLKTAWRCHCDVTHKSLLNLASIIVESTNQREKEINFIFTLPPLIPNGNQNLVVLPPGSKEWDVSLKPRASTRSSTSVTQKLSQTADTRLASRLQVSTSVPARLEIMGGEKTTSPASALATHAALEGNSITSSAKELKTDHHETLSQKSGAVRKFLSNLSRRNLFSKRSELSIRTSSTSTASVNSAKSAGTQLYKIPEPLEIEEHMRRHDPRVFSYRHPPVSIKVSTPHSSTGTLSPEDTAVHKKSLSGSSANVAEAELIGDLCKALWECDGKSSLGFLGNEHESHDHLELICKTSTIVSLTDSKSTKSLNDLLANASEFSAHNKAVVALILAKAILQLHTTQWVNENWTKKDVFFKIKDNGVMFENVYFAREFPSFIQTPPPSLAAVATTKEDHKHSSQYQLLEKIARLSNSLECLGLVLVELGLPPDQSLDKLMDQDGKGKSTGVNEYKKLSQSARNQTLLLVYDNNPMYYEAVQSCFLPRKLETIGSQYEAVMKDLYADIILPLEELNRTWDRQRRLK